MWALSTDVGDVYMGFPFDTTEQVELVLHPQGEMRSPNIVAPPLTTRSKISFHATGKYKFESNVGETVAGIDRVTVQGPAPMTITEPRRMLEIIMPAELPIAERSIGPGDIVLDTTNAPSAPFRCTVYCMTPTQFEAATARALPTVDTSIWESRAALENATHVWSWTLRVSANDKVQSDRFRVFLVGPIRWGSALTGP